MNEYAMNELAMNELATNESATNQLGRRDVLPDEDYANKKEVNP